MARLNTRRNVTQLYSPVTTVGNTPDTRTHQGGPGYTRDLKSELFILGVSLLAGEDTFYESADERQRRFVSLITDATQAFPTWTAVFLRWLRTEANVRTAALIGAAEYVRAVLAMRCAADGCGAGPVNWWTAAHGWRCDAHGNGTMAHIRPRAVVDSVCVRADEPAELVAYWLSTYGRALPMALKRGAADAMIRLGTERNVIKWDSDAKGVRFADVLNLCHPGDRRASAQHLRGEWQHDLFGYLTTVTHVEDLPIPDSLGMLTRRQVLLSLPVEARRAALDPARLEEAGITWEGLAGWLQGPMDAHAWESIIPAMGYMALLRNLRNFDEAGVSDAVAEQVMARLRDPNEVARSRQFPYRFLSAYLAAPSDRWRYTLGQALDVAVTNIPLLSGRTLVCCDTSASMRQPMSGKAKMSRAQAGALFAVALAYRCGGTSNVELIGYADGTFRHELAWGGSVLRQVERFTNRIGEVGHGTATAHAVAAHYRGQDRVVIVTDEQCWDNPTAAIPADVFAYTFNVSGYAAAQLPSGQSRRHTLGGMTDATFRLMALLEAGSSADWEDLFGTPIQGE